MQSTAALMSDVGLFEAEIPMDGVISKNPAAVMTCILLLVLDDMGFSLSFWLTTVQGYYS